MFSLNLRDSHVLGTLAASLVCIGGVAAWLKFRRRPSAEEIERERRARLVRSGRIIDGTILDVSDFDPDGPPREQQIRFLSYKYEIGGVAYECSQDVTALRDRVKAEDLRLGFPCSVRYDIHRPENSIVLAENWSGLRISAHSVPVDVASHGRRPQGAASATQFSRRD